MKTEIAIRLSGEVLRVDTPTVKLLPSQRRFFGASDQIRMLWTSIGGGSTRGGAELAYYLMLRYPGIRGLGLSWGGDAMRVGMRSVGKLVDPRLVAGVTGAAGARLHLKNGSSLQFGDLAGAPLHNRVGPIGFFWIDGSDQIPDTEALRKSGRTVIDMERVVTYLLTRLNQRLEDGTWPALVGFVTGHPNGHDWAWRMFHSDSPDRIESAFFIPEPFDENKANVPPGYYERLLKVGDQDWVKRFIHGSFDEFTAELRKQGPGKPEGAGE